VVDDEAAKMSQRLDQTMSEFSDSMKTRWPLEDILGIDIIAAAQRRIEDKLKLPIKTEELDDALWVKADSFSLVFALVFPRRQTAGSLRTARAALPAQFRRPAGLS
jgi:DNA polymerase-3 subunit epsilon